MSGDHDIKHFSMPPGSAEVSRLGSIVSNRFDSAGMRDALSDAIRTIVLPRMLERRRVLASGLGHDHDGVTAHDVATLLACVTAADPAPSEKVLEALRTRTISRAAILIDLFVPVAQQLVALRDETGTTFADVTLGLSRLRSLIRSDHMQEPPGPAGPHGRILITCARKDQHILWSAIVEDLFRSAGWDATILSESDPEALVSASHDVSADVIALVLQDGAANEDVAATAAWLRARGRGRLICITCAMSPADHGGSMSLPPISAMETVELARACVRAGALLKR
jgi:MerR family transcriptional regulator, light-induced transcriptional regulator